MSTTATENQTETPEVEVKPFEPTDKFVVGTDEKTLTKQAREITRTFAQGILKVETFAWHLAEVALAYGGLQIAPEYSVNVKDPSKQKGYRKPGSAPCPDWGLQSPEYKAWKRANIDAVAAKVVEDTSLLDSIMSNRFRYRVQTLRSKTVDAAVLASLNLSTESQSQRQARIAAENAERARNATTPIGATLFNEERALQTETVGDNQPIPVHEIASAVGIAIEALHKRLDPETVAAMGKKERQTLASLIEQEAASLSAMYETLTSEVSEQVAA